MRSIAQALPNCVSAPYGHACRILQGKWAGGLLQPPISTRGGGLKKLTGNIIVSSGNEKDALEPSFVYVERNRKALWHRVEIAAG